MPISSSGVARGLRLSSRDGNPSLPLCFLLIKANVQGSKVNSDGREAVRVRTTTIRTKSGSLAPETDGHTERRGEEKSQARQTQASVRESALHSSSCSVHQEDLEAAEPQQQQASQCPDLGA